jgi:hypothetical protein
MPHLPPSFLYVAKTCLPKGLRPLFFAFLPEADKKICLFANSVVDFLLWRAY